jgi:type I restriction enzyme S subunit
LSSSWPKVELAEVLTQKWRFEENDPAKEYLLIGAHWYAGGLYIKNRKFGREIQANKLYQIRAGDFVYNRLFAWKGSFALADAGVDGCYVSNEFPVFEINNKRLDGRFLHWNFKREKTWTESLGMSVGATPTSRNRLKEALFLKMLIPLPPLAEQHRIVARIEEIAAQINEAGTLRKKQELEIRQMLLSAFQRVINGAPRLPMREVAPLVRRPVQIDLFDSYLELGIRSFGKGTFHKPAITGAEVCDKRVFHIQPGDLVFNNVFAWEGAIAVAKPEDAGRVGSHRFMSCVSEPEVATSNFLCFFFLTDEGLELTRAASPGGAGRNRTLGLAALDSIRVPIPHIDKQRGFDALQTQVDALKRLQAETAAELDALLPSLLDRAFKGEL